MRRRALRRLFVQAGDDICINVSAPHPHREREILIRRRLAATVRDGRRDGRASARMSDLAALVVA